MSLEKSDLSLKEPDSHGLTRSRLVDGEVGLARAAKGNLKGLAIGEQSAGVLAELRRGVRCLEDGFPALVAFGPCRRRKQQNRLGQERAASSNRTS